MYVLIFPVVMLPVAREFGLTIAEAAPLSFPMYLLYGGSAIPAGFIADRWSRIGVLRVCMFGMGFSSIAAGLSSGGAELTLSLAALGFFCGLYHPAGMALIAHEIDKQGRAHGTNGIFGNFGYVAAPFIAGFALMAGDWRTAFWVTGVLGFLGVAMSFVWSVKETHFGEMKKKTIDASRRDHMIYFAILCVTMTTAGFTYRANLMALPAYFEMRTGDILSMITAMVPASFTGDAGAQNALSGAAGLLVGSVFIFSMMGQFFGGKMADRYDLRWAYLIYQSAAIPFVVAMYFLWQAPLYFVAAGYVFFSIGMQPIENSLVSKFLPTKWLSTGYGIKFTLVFGLGSFAVWQVAAVEKSYGLSALYPILAGQAGLISLLAFILIVASRKTMPRVVNDG